MLILDNFIDSNNLKNVSAAVAVLSGVVTLIANLTSNDKEIQKIYDLASKFLALREEIENILSKPEFPPKALAEATTKISKEYVKLSSEADVFEILPSKVRSRAARPDQLSKSSEEQTRSDKDLDD
jgi:hypothetical protein